MAQLAEKFLLGRFARISCGSLLLVAVAMAVTGNHLEAAAGAAGAALIWSSPAFRPGRDSLSWKSINQVILLLTFLILLTSLWSGPQGLTHWLYALPLVAFGLLPAAWGALLTATTVVAVMVASTWATGAPERHQLVAALLLTVVLSCVLVFLREYKTRQLAPLRRTDELTQAASREYLSADLHKEIQRSEREGTAMAVMMIGLDTHLSDTSPDADIRSILPRIGRFLHSQLRDFDTYYRVADLQFLAILPGTNSHDAALTAENLRKGLQALLASHDLDLTVSAGVAALNIGDDADSLQQSAANALRRAQQQGGNRIQTFSSRPYMSEPGSPATSRNPAP